MFQGLLPFSPNQWERFLHRYASVKASLHPYGSWGDWTMLRSLYQTWRRQQLCTGMSSVPRWALPCPCQSMGFILCLWSLETPNWSSCTLWEKRAPSQASCRRIKLEECTTSVLRWAGHVGVKKCNIWTFIQCGNEYSISIFTSDIYISWCEIITGKKLIRLC